MNSISLVRLVILLAAIFFQPTLHAQVNCSTLNLNNTAGKLVWAKSGNNNQWQYCDPIRREIQRIMPQPLPGLYATNSIAFGNGPAVPNTPAAPRYYECYLMLKKYECLKTQNKIQPEGETGCWVYFVINSVLPEGAQLLSRLHFGYYKNEGGLYVGDFSTRKDGNGNTVLYVSDFNKTDDKVGLFYSAKDRLPVRCISWKELLLSYKTVTDKEISSSIRSKKEGLAKNQQEVQTTKFADTKEYLTRLIEDRKKEIAALEAEQKALNNWYEQQGQHKKINDTARVMITRLNRSEIERLMNLDKKEGTLPVWIEDISYYDPLKPKDQPQSILMWYRRQDNELPKKLFMDQFLQQFNLNVLARIVGADTVKKSGNNSVLASLGTAKSSTQQAQQQKGPVSFSFDQAVVGRYPDNWTGMKNVVIESVSNKKQLALNQDGYWYPQQYNREIKNRFRLSANLSWNKDIAYNSGLFTVSFCSLDYDNANEQYTAPAGGNLLSLYDSYTAQFNRVICWFDPYANNGGQLTIYSYARNESVLVSKKVNLPEFTAALPVQQLRFERKDNNLQVYLNDRLVTELTNVFMPAVKYNAFTFSRYKGNNSDNRKDVFYLSGVEAEY